MAAKRGTPIRNAAEAMSDLNILYAVMAILEGGCIYTRGGQSTAQKIIKICKQETSKQLRAFDDACYENNRMLNNG